MFSLIHKFKTLDDKTILNGLFVLFLSSLVFSISTERYWIMALPFVLIFIYIVLHHFRFLYWLLLVSIAFSITLDFNKRLSTDFPTEFISIGLTAIFWTWWLVYKPKYLNYLWNHKIFWGLIAIWIWSVISSLQAVQVLISIKYVLAKVFSKLRLSTILGLW